MATPGLVQSAVAVSSTASPTTITPTLGLASTAGTLLLISVWTSGGNPGINTPSNWTNLNTTVGGSGSIALFSFPNNPGAITAVPITVSASTGVVASIFEFSPLANQTVEYILESQAAGTNIPQLYLQPQVCTSIAELEFVTIGYNTATLTPAGSSEFSASIAGGVSTGGSPNAQISNFWGLSTLTGPLFSGTLSVGVAWAALGVRFKTYPGSNVTHANISGAMGFVSPNFTSGMIGG